MRVGMMDMQLVPNEEKYWEFIRSLRNLNTGFVEKVQISQEQQRSYMSVYGDSYFIALVDEEPAGFVGSIDNDIRVSTVPKFRGMGVGEFMVKEIHKLFPNATAKVLVENEASHNLFKKAGFTPVFITYEKNTP